MPKEWGLREVSAFCLRSRTFPKLVPSSERAGHLLHERPCSQGVTILRPNQSWMWVVGPVLSSPVPSCLVWSGGSWAHCRIACEQNTERDQLVTVYTQPRTPIDIQFIQEPKQTQPTPTTEPKRVLINHAQNPPTLGYYYCSWPTREEEWITTMSRTNQPDSTSTRECITMDDAWSRSMDSFVSLSSCSRANISIVSCSGSKQYVPLSLQHHINSCINTES